MPEFVRITSSRFSARADQLREIRGVTEKAVQGIAACEQDSDAIVLAINEACMNIIQHAYGENSNGEILLEIFLADDGMLFRITDDAATVGENSIKRRSLEEVRPGGLGVNIIHEVMDKVEYLKPKTGQGNVLEMRKNIPVKCIHGQGSTGCQS